MKITASQLSSEQPPRCEVMFLFLNAISEAVSDSGFSRNGIIDRMNEALGGEIVVTPDKFSKWLAPSSDRHFPMMYIPALCWAVKNTNVVDVLLQPIHFKTVDERGQTLQHAAQKQLEAKKLNQEAEALMASVSIEKTEECQST